MSLFSSIAKNVLPIALTVMTGGAAAPLVMAQQLAIRALASQIINMAAQQLGVSPAILQTAMAAFGNTSGLGQIASLANGSQTANWTDLLSQAGSSPAQIGEALRTFNQASQEVEGQVKDWLQDQLNELNRNNENKKTDKDVKSIMAGKGSILMKLAIALGQIADQKMNDMAKKAEDIGNMGKIEAKNQSKFTQMNAELSALGQEYNVVSQAMSNVLKSIGEGSSTIARKT